MKPYFKSALIYACFGVLWILLSDKAVAMIWSDAASITTIQTAKGWLYVGLTAALVYYLGRRAHFAQMEFEAKKMRIFSHTVNGAHHILRNYLNQMQLVTFEAKDCPDFDPEVIAQAEQITEDATRELDTLGALASGQFITEDSIDNAVFKSLRRP